LSTLVQQRRLPAAGPAADILSTSVTFLHPGGSPAAARRVHDHYLQALAAAGWAVATNQPGRGRQPQAGLRLNLTGHGYHLVWTMSPGPSSITTRAAMTEIVHTGTTPGQPAITMPAWWAALPEPPPTQRRHQLQVAATYGEPTSYVITYQEHADGRGSAAGLATHYRAALPAAGWQLRSHHAHLAPPGPAGPAEYRETLSFTGTFGGLRATGAATARETVSNAGHGGTRLTIAVDSISQRP